MARRGQLKGQLTRFKKIVNDIRKIIIKYLNSHHGFKKSKSSSTNLIMFNRNLSSWMTGNCGRAKEPPSRMIFLKPSLKPRKLLIIIFVLINRRVRRSNNTHWLKIILNPFKFSQILMFDSRQSFCRSLMGPTKNDQIFTTHLRH